MKARPEKAIQNAILHFLRVQPECMAFEVYNSGKFLPKVGRFVPNNSAFRPKGIPDIIAIYRGNTFWLEVKTPEGRLSLEQKVLHERMWKLGWMTYVVRSVEDVQTVLKGYQQRGAA